MAVQTPLACAILALLGGAGMLWRQMSRQQQQQQEEEEQQAGLKVKRRQKQITASGSAADISTHEFTVLQSFVHKVHNWRGWQSSLYHITQAWHEVETTAATAAGGAWLPDFDGLQLSCDNCDRLLRILDDVFFAGKLLKRLRSKSNQQHVRNSSAAARASCRVADASISSPAAQFQSAGLRLQCQIVQAHRPQDTWLCYFDPDDNAIYINRWRWGKNITADQPVNCEGVICTSRLQMLLHTIAHELVHAIVFHLFPEIDQSSPAYLPNDRHGPVFLLLNKQLFGHTSTALEHV